MPQGDGTGPRGLGRMTGRGFGPCGTMDNAPNESGMVLSFFDRLRRRFGFNRNVRGGNRGMGRSRGMGGQGRNR
ncbi:MAG TPA: hypothetical protein ENO00_08205 [Deltaproteobacteria bacterium]|nr:hypothetical protein [Deltaproteobacteria bacterium]